MGKAHFRRPPSAVGAILRRLRSERGMSQASLAGEVGVSTRHLGFVEIGRSAPSAAFVERMAAVLEASAVDRAAMFMAAGYAPPGLEPEDLVWPRWLVDSCPYAISAIDCDLFIVLANGAHVRLIGAPSHQAVIGESMQTCPIWSVPEARKIILSCLEEGTSASFEVWGKTRFARSFCARGELLPIRDPDGHLVGAETIMREVPAKDRDLSRIDFELFSHHSM